MNRSCSQYLAITQSFSCRNGKNLVRIRHAGDAKGAAFRPPLSQKYELSGLALKLDLDVDAGRKFDALERIDGLVVWLDDVDKTLVDAHFKVLARVFVNVWSADNRETMLVGRQGNWSTNLCVGAKNRFHNHACRLVDDVVIECLEADKKADRKTAINIFVQSALLAAAITLVFFALPL